MLRGAELLVAARRVLGIAQAGLLTDVDGTLSAIVPRPEQAVVRAPVRQALRRLVPRLAVVAAVSGRAAADVRRLVGVPGLVYVGNHGLEARVGRRRWEHPEAALSRPRIAAALAALEATLHLPGLQYEPKGLTASIHYRNAVEPERACAAILAALAARPEADSLRVTEGRRVVELRPPVQVNKGTAVACLLRRHALQGALFLGDDRTDVDAARALHNARAAGLETLVIAVESDEAPTELLAEADGVVQGVDGVEVLLRALAAPDGSAAAAAGNS